MSKEIDTLGSDTLGSGTLGAPSKDPELPNFDDARLGWHPYKDTQLLINETVTEPDEN